MTKNTSGEKGSNQRLAADEQKRLREKYEAAKKAAPSEAAAAEMANRESAYKEAARREAAQRELQQKMAAERELARQASVQQQKDAALKEALLKRAAQRESLIMAETQAPAEPAPIETIAGIQREETLSPAFEPAALGYIGFSETGAGHDNPAHKEADAMEESRIKVLQDYYKTYGIEDN